MNVNQVDIFGRTPIFYAAERGNTEICEILVRLGAEI